MNSANDLKVTCKMQLISDIFKRSMIKEFSR
jgi:hypothetical protein